MSNLDNPSKNEIPKLINAYKLEMQTDQGLFYEEYMGENRYTEEKVFIKVFDKELIRKYNQSIEFINNMITVSKLLYHRYILSLLEFFETPNHIFVVSEFFEGQKLSNYLKNKNKIEEQQAKQIFTKIIEAMVYIHSMNICHRNISPDSILYNESTGEIKITNFFYGCYYFNNETLLYDGVGIPKYSCPEMYKNNHYTPESADIFSCGLLLSLLIIGNLPFGVDSHNPELLNFMEYKLPKNLNPDLTDFINKVLAPIYMERINLKDICQHQWFQGGELSNPLPGINLFQTVYPVDDRILKVCQAYGFDSKTVKEDLYENKYNNLTAAYKLIVKKVEKLGKTSISDLKSKEFIDYANNQQTNNQIKITKEAFNKSEEERQKHQKEQSEKISEDVLNIYLNNIGEEYNKYISSLSEEQKALLEKKRKEQEEKDRLEKERLEKEKQEKELKEKLEKEEKERLEKEKEIQEKLAKEKEIEEKLLKEKEEKELKEKQEREEKEKQERLAKEKEEKEKQEREEKEKQERLAKEKLEKEKAKQEKEEKERKEREKKEKELKEKETININGKLIKDSSKDSLKVSTDFKQSKTFNMFDTIKNDNGRESPSNKENSKEEINFFTPDTALEKVNGKNKTQFIPHRLRKSQKMNTSLKKKRKNEFDEWVRINDLLKRPPRRRDAIINKDEIKEAVRLYQEYLEELKNQEEEEEDDNDEEEEENNESGEEEDESSVSSSSDSLKIEELKSEDDDDDEEKQKPKTLMEQEEEKAQQDFLENEYKRQIQMEEERKRIIEQQRRLSEEEDRKKAEALRLEKEEQERSRRDRFKSRYNSIKKRQESKAKEEEMEKEKQEREAQQTNLAPINIETIEEKQELNSPTKEIHKTGSTKSIKSNKQEQIEKNKEEKHKHTKKVNINKRGSVNYQLLELTDKDNEIDKTPEKPRNRRRSTKNIGRNIDDISNFNFSKSKQKEEIREKEIKQQEPKQEQQHKPTPHKLEEEKQKLEEDEMKETKLETPKFKSTIETPKPKPKPKVKAKQLEPVIQTPRKKPIETPKQLKSTPPIKREEKPKPKERKVQIKINQESDRKPKINKLSYMKENTKEQTPVNQNKQEPPKQIEKINNNTKLNQLNLLVQVKKSNKSSIPEYLFQTKKKKTKLVRGEKTVVKQFNPHNGKKNHNSSIGKTNQITKKISKKEEVENSTLTPEESELISPRKRPSNGNSTVISNNYKDKDNSVVTSVTKQGRDHKKYPVSLNTKILETPYDTQNIVKNSSIGIYTLNSKKRYRTNNNSQAKIVTNVNDSGEITERSKFNYTRLNTSSRLNMMNTNVNNSIITNHPNNSIVTNQVNNNSIITNHPNNSIVINQVNNSIINTTINYNNNNGSVSKLNPKNSSKKSNKVRLRILNLSSENLNGQFCNTTVHWKKGGIKRTYSSESDVSCHEETVPRVKMNDSSKRKLKKFNDVQIINYSTINNYSKITKKKALIRPMKVERERSCYASLPNLHTNTNYTSNYLNFTNTKTIKHSTVKKKYINRSCEIDETIENFDKYYSNLNNSVCKPLRHNQSSEISERNLNKTIDSHIIYETIGKPTNHKKTNSIQYTSQKFITKKMVLSGQKKDSLKNSQKIKTHPAKIVTQNYQTGSNFTAEKAKISPVSKKTKHLGMTSISNLEGYQTNSVINLQGLMQTNGNNIIYETNKAKKYEGLIDIECLQPVSAQEAVKNLQYILNRKTVFYVQPNPFYFRCCYQKTSFDLEVCEITEESSYYLIKFKSFGANKHWIKKTLLSTF